MLFSVVVPMGLLISGPQVRVLRGPPSDSMCSAVRGGMRSRETAGRERLQAANARNLAGRRSGDCARSGREGLGQLAPRRAPPARVAEWQTRPV